jgi:hypothetical protein
MDAKPLVGAVYERNPTTHVGGAATFTGSATNGFPQVQHRSKSVFGRTKAEQRRSANSPLKGLHTVKGGYDMTPASSSSLPSPTKPDPSDWRPQISDENRKRVESMTEEERQREISEVFEQLGQGARDTMQKIITARKRKEGPSNTQDDQRGSGIHQPRLPEILAPGALTFSRCDELSPIPA